MYFDPGRTGPPCVLFAYFLSFLTFCVVLVVDFFSKIWLTRENMM